METGDGPTFDGGDEERVCVIGVVLDEIFGRLFGRDGDERNAFIRWFEPHDLGFLLLSVVLWLGG